MKVATSVEFFEEGMGWVIERDTLQIVNGEECTWIAQARTTHLHEHGAEEKTFILLAREFTHFLLNQQDVPSLAQWCTHMMRYLS